MSEPWNTHNWWTSPLNFDPQALGDFKPQAPVLHDVTLRDGEECAGLVFNTEDKFAIVKALDDAGVGRIEVLVTTPGADKALRAIMEMGLRATVYAAGKLAEPKNMAKAVNTGVRHVTLGMRTSDILIERVLRKTRAAVLDQTLKAIHSGKEHGFFINLFLADSTRADLGFLAECIGRCEEAGIDTVTVVDTLGVANPQAVAYLIGKVCTFTKLPVEAHMHNDYGLGMATALAAWQAGATTIHCAVNGLGYRCGNPATEELVLALRALYGVDTGIDISKLYALSRLVQERSCLPVAYNKPLSGPGAFAFEQYAQLVEVVESGVPQANYPYVPESIGRHPQMVVSKWSDLSMVKHKLTELGRTLGDAQAQQVLEKAKEKAYAQKHPLSDEQLIALADQVS